MRLEPEKEEWIHRFIREKLQFFPGSKQDFFLPFSINRAFSVYDISQMTEDQIDLLNELAPRAIQNCLKPGHMIYAIDWNHNTILYDPLQPGQAQAVHPSHVFYTSDGLGYYYGFYPDGDYIFYIDRFGAFGYLAHPWREEVWIFGLPLVCEFEKICSQLGWKVKANLK